jgi:heme/copper-type cytochrome/quinol oxidase subunit 2
MQLIIGIYCLGVIGYLIGYLVSNEFSRKEGEGDRAYARRSVANILCVVMWPLVLVSAIVLAVLSYRLWNNGQY